MAHELVFRTNAEGKDEARMFYKHTDGASLPWHGFGAGKESWTVDEAKTFLDVSSPVEVEPCFLGDGTLVDGVAITKWEGRQIGIVGPNYKPLQNSDFLDSFRAWEETGLGELETGMYLRGGQILCVQVRIKGMENLKIVGDDCVRPYAFLSNGHDRTIGMIGGYCLTRIVCNNTRRMAVRELGDGAVRAKHTGNVTQKVNDIQKTILAIKAQADKDVEVLRWLATVKVADQMTVRRFCRMVQGSKAEMKEDKLSRVESDVLARFENGIGLTGQNFYELVCAWDERITHGEGNEKTGESEADRVGRRLENSLFGVGAMSLNKALSVAVELAQAA